MNGPHDMGGLHGHGPVLTEPHEPVFHDEWERRAFALTLAMGFSGEWNIDQSRFARESIPPAEYLASSYYRIWFEGMRQLLRERGLVRDSELSAGHAQGDARPVLRVLALAEVDASLGRGGPTLREPATPARFAAGDAVRALNVNPAAHTRLPRYVRGHLGTVERLHGCHVFPDSNAQGRENPQWLYAVRFGGRELWGPDGDPASAVVIDAFEPYLEPA